MITYKHIMLAGGGTRKILQIFNKSILIIARSDQFGWARMFGMGITWRHKDVNSCFNERIGKKKKIKIGNYIYGYLKP